MSDCRKNENFSFKCKLNYQEGNVTRDMWKAVGWEEGGILRARTLYGYNSVTMPNNVKRTLMVARQPVFNRFVKI